MTSLGQYAGTIREILGISDELKMLFGIAFGYPDESVPSVKRPRQRAVLSENVAFHA